MRCNGGSLPGLSPLTCPFPRPALWVVPRHSKRINALLMSHLLGPPMVWSLGRPSGEEPDAHYCDHFPPFFIASVELFAAEYMTLAEPPPGTIPHLHPKGERAGNLCAPLQSYHNVARPQQSQSQFCIIESQPLQPTPLAIADFSLNILTPAF